MNDDINLRPLGDGTISLFLKAKDTLENENTYRAFKLFCEKEAKNDYTFGLKLLLENLDYVHSLNALWSRLDEVESKLVIMDNKDIAPVSEKKDFF